MTRISIAALGPRAREQVCAKLDGAAVKEKKAAELKYRNKKVEIDGFTFDSTAEGAFYLWQVYRQRAGEIRSFMRQVSVPLNCKKRMVFDFVVVHLDGQHDWIDVKGKETQAFKIKAASFEQETGLKVQLVRREDIPQQYLKTATELRGLNP